MSFDSVRPFLKNQNAMNGKPEDVLKQWDERLRLVSEHETGAFHGDALLADKQRKQTGILEDLWRVFTPSNAPEVLKVALIGLQGKGLDKVAGAKLIGSLPNDSKTRVKFIQEQVKIKYEKMLHPPITYLGDAFQYRAPDGKFNSVLHPHLGAAGAPYAKTVPSKTHVLGALPDPGDVFDKLMAREEGGRNSPSGLSSMLIYHATIIIHDIFRTNESDKNLSDSSSYLDLSPLYGYNLEMQMRVRDDKFKLGLLKPDTFAEDRLLRQPPGVCIMLVMYNRYHNYAATQLKRINENGRFSVPAQFEKQKWLAVAASEKCVPTEKRTKEFNEGVESFAKDWQAWEKQGQKPVDRGNKEREPGDPLNDKDYKETEKKIRELVNSVGDTKAIDLFVKSHDAAWEKVDDDLFNTARLITCGLYINIAIHDYLRALMGFHQYDTNFTLEPRAAMDHKNVSRGLGNQVTVEFNLLYRFHCAISQKDEQYTEQFMREAFDDVAKKSDPSTPASHVPETMKNLSMQEFGVLAREMKYEESGKTPWLVEFGLKKDPKQCFKRNTITGLFDDQAMIDQLKSCMDDPISNFGPRNTPRCLKNVEVMGILQARKWEIGTLNDFRDFFGMKRHTTFEEMSKSAKVQNALRDLYDHPDKVELYPGIFCESDANMGDDPGPSDVDSALWAAIFSDAITLVRSDRFYTVDWNTNSLTSWGMKEVSPDYDNLKTSVFHRLLQRAFPEWFPYDSIRFFHPFYTAETNAKYATEQGYAPNFKFGKALPKPASGEVYDCQASQPAKPEKPYFLNKYDDIERVLATGANEIIHPAFAEPANLPRKVQEALRSIQRKKANDAGDAGDSPEDATLTRSYFAYRMRAIVEREVITMNANEGGSVYQLDVTRDLAIPVVTRCIADFLGFSDQLRDTSNLHAKYSENEVYQHITNCQTFLSYNADETKLLKRRTDFKTSMDFLLKLAEEGNVLEASRWRMSKPLRDIGSAIGNMFKQKVPQDEKLAASSMKALGKGVAARILEEVKDSGKAAAVLLLTALDVAYMEVLAFTASLDHLLQGAYDEAKNSKPGSCEWFEIQKLATDNKNGSDEEIQKKVLQAQKASIKLPFIRKVVKDGLKIKLNGKEEVLKKGQVIICDIFEAMNPKDPKEADAVAKKPHLNYSTSLSTGLIDFNPKSMAVHALTAMIKVMAQMKDLRRGHTSQGLVKRIEIDQTYEGYANFMAPGRMQMIAHDAQQAALDLKNYRDTHNGQPSSSNPSEVSDLHEKLLVQRVVDASKIFSQDILKPKQDTYLTAEWDEMVPFPTTWKLRFEGYGPSTYGGASLLKLRPQPLPDYYPPFYQPSGPSHYGGVFATATATQPPPPPGVGGTEKGGEEGTAGYPCDWVDKKTKGCGAPAPVLHSASEELGRVAIEGKAGMGTGEVGSSSAWLEEDE